MQLMNGTNSGSGDIENSHAWNATYLHFTVRVVRASQSARRPADILVSAIV